jgi:hypothetical protein
MLRNVGFFPAGSVRHTLAIALVRATQFELKFTINGGKQSFICLPPFTFKPITDQEFSVPLSQRLFESCRAGSRQP